MTRVLFAAFGGVCYFAFLATFAWFMAFVGGVFLPRTIDTPTSLGVAAAIAIDLGLVALFAAQHSVMARPAFKRLWTRVVPPPIERSVYVLLSSAVLAALMLFWQGIDVVVWNVESSIGRAALWTLFVAGWLAVPGVSLMISHADLFGLRQVWFHLRGKPYEPLPFRTPWAYRYVRHPLYIGWAVAFWATPTMTAGHLLFAVAMTVYMAVATIFEERDLLDYFGDTYADYRRRVPRFFPLSFRRRATSADIAAMRVDSRHSCPEI